MASIAFGITTPPLASFSGTHVDFHLSRLLHDGLLYETVPAFEDTWIECLGDLGRYRMAIEDDDVHDREVWQNVARFWYSKAADKTPVVGRLYHHLAILARPKILQQLFCYCKSLGVSQPFSSARESNLQSSILSLTRMYSEAEASQLTLIHTAAFDHVLPY